MGGIGFFGGMFRFQGYKKPVLVSSVDGVGTKLKLASALGRHEGVGMDIVNHCVNDILTCGAAPLFFLDYIAAGRLEPRQVESVVKGLSLSCRQVGCALIGGETAEMPGLYAGGDYDLAGFIVGVVEEDAVMDGSSITAGDVVLGLPSSGLHTNGYSLVRKIFGETAADLSVRPQGLDKTLGEVLLEPHRCYYNELKDLLGQIKGLAHITGGGFEGNVPRVLPAGLMVRLDSAAWEAPPIFKLIQEKGNVERDEMYRVFNMGIGMAVFCSQSDADVLKRKLPGAGVIGEVVEGGGGVVIE